MLNDLATVKRDDGRSGGGFPISEAPYNGCKGWFIIFNNGNWEDGNIPTGRLITIKHRKSNNKEAIRIIERVLSTCKCGGSGCLAG